MLYSFPQIRPSVVPWCDDEWLGVASGGGYRLHRNTEIDNYDMASQFLEERGHLGN